MRNKNLLYILLFTGTALFSGCKKNSLDPTPTDQKINQRLAVYPSWPETFNTGTKGSYAAADVLLGTGSWNLSDALLGNLSGDRKNGAQAARIQNTGMITMNFDLANGASTVSILHAKYGTDANSTWELWYSTNSGSTWTQTGGTITTSSITLTPANFTLTTTGNVRFQLRKLSGGRLNIDDFSANDNTGGSGGSPTQDDNLAMGNPSGAITNAGNPNNYLMVKTQYTIAYDNSRGSPKWVSWHLSSAWKGGAARCDCFSADATLPATFYKAFTSHYTNSGFTRGHMSPSEDRDLTSADNAATFIMTNIIPQSTNNNSGTWGSVEEYSRTLLATNNEMYIISGGYGTGGSHSSTSGIINTINGGLITVPSRLWKVIVILPVGSSDVSRVTTSTRVIAIDTPNSYNSTSQTWGTYRTSVNAIEAATGLDLLSNISATIQNTIEATVDIGPTN